MLGKNRKQQYSQEYQKVRRRAAAMSSGQLIDWADSSESNVAMYMSYYRRNGGKDYLRTARNYASELHALLDEIASRN